MMRTFLTVLVASFFLFLSFASAEGDFDSMKGRTQFDVSGNAGYSTYSGLSLSVSAGGFHYLTPQFGIGGVADVTRFGGSTDGIFYSIGPAAEYFIPVGHRGHIFAQGIASLSGWEKSNSNISLTARAGYRYFVTDDIALSAKLSQSWSRANVESGRTTTNDPTLMFGFSLFF